MSAGERLAERSDLAGRGGAGARDVSRAGRVGRQPAGAAGQHPTACTRQCSLGCVLHTAGWRCLLVCRGGSRPLEPPTCPAHSHAPRARYRQPSHPDLLLSTLRACPAHALLPCTPRVAPIDATQGALIYTESSRLEAASPNGADLAQDVLSAAEDRIVKAVRLELERHRAAVAADLARHMEQVDRVSQPPPHHHHFAGLRREG